MAALGSQVHLAFEWPAQVAKSKVVSLSPAGQGSTHSVLHAHSLEGIVSLGCFP